MIILRWYVADGCVQYKLPEPWKAAEGDYIGFTNQGDVGAISFSDNADHRTLFVGQNAESIVQVGQEFEFSGVLRGLYSIAVQLAAGQSDHLLHRLLYQ